MKLPRRKFLHLAAGAAALPAISRVAWAQTYPTRPVHIIVGFPAGGRDRHHGAPDRSMAVGTAWTASLSSKIGRAQAAILPPRRSLTRPQTAIRSSWSQPANVINATLYEKLKLQFHSRYRADREYPPDSSCHGRQSIGSGQDGSGVHRLCQGQSGQGQQASGWQRSAGTCGR